MILIGSGAAGLAMPRLPLWAVDAARPGLEELAERLRKAPRPQAFDVAADAIRRGVDVPTMLGAVFLCGVREIRPRPHGILHSVMMVESCFQLAEPAVPAEAWLPVLWNLDDLKRSQEEDRVEAGDWVLPAPRPVRAVSASAARQEFVAAMEAWDADRADRALLDLLPHVDHDAFFEILWPLACRCSAFIGHKMIYTVQIERATQRIGWDHAQPALRNLVMTLLVDRRTEDFERARELAPRLPVRWQDGKEDPAHSAVLLKELRVRDARGAQGLMVQAFNEGLGPRTVWDAMRLLGSEVFLRRPGRRAEAGRSALLPVHALTVTSAMGHASRTTRLDATRRLLIMQAAAWLALIRDAMVEIVSLSMKGAGIDQLGESPAPGASTASSPMESARPERLRPWLDREPDKASSYLAHLRMGVFRKAQEHHQHKYAAAVAEESRLVHPTWASRILAPAAEYVAHPDDPETEVYRRSVRALREAGVARAG